MYAIRSYYEYPAITAQVVEEDEEHYGCAGGGTERFYINAKGDVQPCEFLNISFGNVKEESFSDIYSRMRDVFKTPGTNWLCDKYSSSVNDNFKLSRITSYNVSIRRITSYNVCYTKLLR